MLWIIKSATLLGLISSGLASFSALASETSEGTSAKVVVIPIRAEIAPPELHILRRGLKDASEQGVKTVVLDMDTPGGRLDVTFDILKAIEKFPGKVITYVNEEAISAGALISAGTEEIYFSPSGIIGSAAPITATGQDIDQTMQSKVVSYLKARVRSVSEEKGYRAEVLSAMIDEDYVLNIGEEEIKPKGELLTLTAKEAMQTYGDPAVPLLGAGIYPNLAGLLNQLYGEGNYELIQLEITWSEKVAKFITSVAPLFIAVGLLLVFIEFKTPGFGVFGISGGVLLTIVFFGHYAAGIAGHEPMLFFLLGFLLVLLEIFLLPGFLLLGIPGVLLIFTSLLWGMADVWPDQEIQFDSDLFLTPLWNLGMGILGAITLFIGMLRFLPNGGLWGKMVLDAAVKGDFTEQDIERNQPSLVGLVGVSVTALYPSGQIEIHGKRFDAHLISGHADPGTKVRVVATGEFELRVELEP